MNIRTTKAIFKLFRSAGAKATRRGISVWKTPLLMPLMGYTPVYEFSQATHNKKHVEIDIESLEDWVSKVTTLEEPVVLSLHAPWCSSCKKLAPILEEKFQNSKGNWIFVKNDVDKFPDLMQGFNIHEVPAVILLHKGKIKGHFIGFPEAHVLDDLINQAESLANKDS